MAGSSACAAAALVTIPNAVADNALDTHDGYYSVVDDDVATLNGAPIYAWRSRHQSRVPSEPVFLFRAVNGAWVIGPNASGHAGKIQSTVFTAPCPGDIAGNESWAFYDGIGSSWRCTPWDPNCAGGSGIMVTPQCVAVDAFATGADRFCFSQCPPSPPGQSPESDGDGGTIVLGAAAGGSFLALLLACFLCRRWRRQIEEIREQERRVRAARTSSSAAHQQSRGRVPPPAPVTVRRERSGLRLPKELSPSRLAVDRHARRGPAYSNVGLEMQPGTRTRPDQFV